MRVIDIIRLLKKNWLLLIMTPLLLAGLVAYLTRTPTYTYSSETTIYTGIASGSSVEMEKSLSFFATNTAFDNLINVLKSRETQQEVAIRLLAQHLLLPGHDARYISKEHYERLIQKTPDYVKALVRKSAGNKPKNDESAISNNSYVDTVATFSFTELNAGQHGNITIPTSVKKEDFEQAVKNLEAYMGSSDTNYVYKLLYFGHPHYSVRAISTVNVQRVASSDLVKLKFNSDDPGICQQTLAMLTEVCMMNYKLISENRSDAVVKYFEHQLKLAADRLKIGEDKLLKFNEDNNIINYYEQSKAVAVVKEQLDNDYNNRKMKLAGAKASISRIEDKLGVQKQIQLKSTNILDKRNQLSEISNKIADAEIIGSANAVDEEVLAKLKQQSETLKDEIRGIVSELYHFGNTVEGLPLSTLLNDWIANVIEYEDTKAGLTVLAERIKEFQKQYAIYAPAGANLKRIEREIGVSEQEFLEILHGLSLAKLKMQDAELSSSIKAVDPPFFPLSPNPTKRKILVMLAAVLGFLFVLSSILITEYFDETLRNPAKASKKLQLSVIGLFPKIILHVGSMNFPFITNRLLEMIIQKIELLTIPKTTEESQRTILFVSSISNEGKTVTAGNIALKLKKQGRKVLFLNYSRDSLRQVETDQIGYPIDPRSVSVSGSITHSKIFQIAARLLGFGKKHTDPSSPFLHKPEQYLSESEYKLYAIDQNYFAAGNYSDLFNSQLNQSNEKPEYVIVEIPAILYYSYPQKLVASADLVVFACRSNRIWTGADQGVLEVLKNVASQEPVVVLNGVDLQVVESVLGDLPKKRSWLRSLLKRGMLFQFNSKHTF